MGGGHEVHVVTLARGGEAAVELAAIPGCAAGLAELAHVGHRGVAYAAYSVAAVGGLVQPFGFGDGV